MAILAGFFDLIFSPITNNLSPRWSLIVISFIITLLSTLAYKYLTNQTVIKAMKEEMKVLQQQVKLHKDDPEKMKETNKTLMSKNLELMKHSMRPTLFTFIPIILVFSWLRETYLPAGDIFSWGFHIPLFGQGIGWLWMYIITSIIMSILLRKALKIH